MPRMFGFARQQIPGAWALPLVGKPWRLYRFLDDPIGAVTRFSWAVTRQVTGVSAGALVTYMPARTVLFMSADASPYRG